jgi:hypothetical protein
VRPIKLILPRYYSRVFEASYPSLIKKAKAGFQDSSTGKTRIATFYQLDEKEVAKIRSFLEWYGQAVCLSINEHLADNFSEELDFLLCPRLCQTQPRRKPLAYRRVGVPSQVP